MAEKTSMEKYLFAKSALPSPNVLATTAVPPVPIMKPKAPKIIKIGIIKLMAAKGILPTKLETNKPSTTL